MKASTPSLLEQTIKDLLLEESYPLDLVTDSSSSADEGGWEGEAWEGGDAEALLEKFKERNRVRVVSLLALCVCVSVCVCICI